MIRFFRRWEHRVKFHQRVHVFFEKKTICRLEMSESQEKLKANISKICIP